METEIKALRSHVRLAERRFDSPLAGIQNHNIEGVKGEYVFTWENCPDLVLWPYLSKEAIAAVTELLVEKRIFPHPAKPLIYAYGGIMVGLPDR